MLPFKCILLEKFGFPVKILGRPEIWYSRITSPSPRICLRRENDLNFVFTCGELATDLISINSLKLDTPWENAKINLAQNHVKLVDSSNLNLTWTSVPKNDEL